jgi:hypothetical protein
MASMVADQFQAGGNRTPSSEQVARAFLCALCDLCGLELSGVYSRRLQNAKFAEDAAVGDVVVVMWRGA